MVVAALRRLAAAMAVGIVLGAPAAAQETTPSATAPYDPALDLASLSGQMIADGSSTVWPVTAEVSELFLAQAPNLRIDIEFSGTGGGFRRFCDGASDIQNASRPIEEDEAATCAANGVAYREFAIGYDGITLVVNPANDWATCLTVEQLRRLWTPGSTVRTWRDLDLDWPNEPIDLYGPGPDSGTFDFFTEAIVGETDASRNDYTPSENDTVLVQGVEEDRFALGYFGFAYYAAEGPALKALTIDAGDGCVAPSVETIGDGTYRPLSRPLYVYVSEASLARLEVREFMRFYAAIAPQAVADVGYVPLAAEVYAANQRAFEAGPGATPAP
jgi:phosphate transport system substrate-binding protein